MTTLRCGVLVLLCATAIPSLASADNIVLDGETSCVAIGGAWSAGACTVDRLGVPAGTHLIVPLGVALATGNVEIDGALSIFGELLATGTLVNRGSLTTYAFIVSTAPIVNQGVWENYGTFRADADVVNDWSFSNRGRFETTLGTFVNWGSVVNIPGGTFVNGGDLIRNEGSLANFGYLVNAGVIDNFGAISNYDATIVNSGTALGRCGSGWYLADLGPGPGPVGNPIVYEPCQPTAAIAALGRSVLELGQRGLIPRGDTAALLKLVLKAGKQLDRGQDDQAVALLRAFGEEAWARIGYSPFDEALRVRAASLVEMIETAD